MKLLIFALLLGALSFGADVAGVWHGSFTPERPDGTQEKEHSAYLALKQDGVKLTGRIGPNEEKNFELTKGMVDGDSVTFEVFADGMQMKVSMKLKDGKLEGVVQAEKEGEEKRKAVVNFTRS